LAEDAMASSGKAYWKGRVSTVDLLLKIGCFVKKRNILSV
jgi:hypothetical protein